MSKFSRSDIWRHNGRLGTVSMFLQGLKEIQLSNVPTERSKELAKQLQPLVEELYGSLKQRAEGEVNSAKAE